MSNDELVELLTKDHDADEREIRAMVRQVEETGYSPPRREKILEWQKEQDFRICPNPDDPDACNVYSELQFPDEVRGHPGVSRGAGKLESTRRPFLDGGAPRERQKERSRSA